MLGGLTSTVRWAEDIESEQHGIGESRGLLLTGEVEPVDLTSITPLVEGGSGLIVFQTLYYGVVYHHLQWEKTGH